MFKQNENIMKKYDLNHFVLVHKTSCEENKHFQMKGDKKYNRNIFFLIQYWDSGPAYSEHTPLSIC